MATAIKTVDEDDPATLSLTQIEDRIVALSLEVRAIKEEANQRKKLLDHFVSYLADRREDQGPKLPGLDGED